MKNFLELTNEAIAESKVTLDPLTSSNFDSPPRTVLYENFKRWVNRSYKDLLIRRNEWEFTQERAVVSVTPRLYLTDVTGIPAEGDTLIGQESEVKLTILAVHAFEEIEGDGVDQYTVDVEVDDGYNLQSLIVNELFDRLTVGAVTGFARFIGVGRYNLIEDLYNAEEINIDSFHSYYTDGTLTSGFPIRAINWQQYHSKYDRTPWVSGTPSFVAKASDGNFVFYPHPDQQYNVSLEYTRGPTLMVAYNDTPVGVPSRYEDYLIWKAVSEYADWDANTKVFARAQKHVNEQLYYLERDQLEQVKFGRSLFDCPYGY